MNEFDVDMVNNQNKSVEDVLTSMTQNSNNAKNTPFRDYAPHVFRYLRTQVFNVSDVEYLQSIRPTDSSKDLQALAKAKFSEGRSGYVFFFVFWFFLFVVGIIHVIFGRVGFFSVVVTEHSSFTLMIQNI